MSFQATSSVTLELKEAIPLLAMGNGNTANDNVALGSVLGPAEYRLSPLVKKHSWLDDKWLTSCAQELIGECSNNATWCKPFKNDHPVYPLGDCIKMCARCGRGSNFAKGAGQNLARNYSNFGCPMTSRKSGDRNPYYVTGGNMTLVAHVTEDMVKYVPNKTKTIGNSLLLVVFV